MPTSRAPLQLPPRPARREGRRPAPPAVLSVLVVDDDLLLARLVKANLDRPGRVRAEAVGSGEEAMASESLEAHVTGDDITTGFNPAYLLDGLTAIESPFVELAFTQASKPVVLSGVDSLEGEADSAFRYLLMPRRLLS